MMNFTKGETRNDCKAYFRLRRIDICDLMLACTAARTTANDGGKKWKILHDYLADCLEDMDIWIDAENDWQQICGGDR